MKFINIVAVDYRFAGASQSEGVMFSRTPYLNRSSVLVDPLMQNSRVYCCSSVLLHVSFQRCDVSSNS